MKKLLLAVISLIFSLEVSAHILNQRFDDKRWIIENIDNHDLGGFILSQPYNKILIGVKTLDRPITNVQYTTLIPDYTDETHDLNFGDNGLTSTSVGGKSVEISSLDLQSDKKL